jgi:hypothetical protein
MLALLNPFLGPFLLFRDATWAACKNRHQLSRAVIAGNSSQVLNSHCRYGRISVPFLEPSQLLVNFGTRQGANAASPAASERASAASAAGPFLPPRATFPEATQCGGWETRRQVRGQWNSWPFATRQTSPPGCHGRWGEEDEALGKVRRRVGGRN